MRDSDLNTATLAATLREMMRRINDLATRPLGRVTLGPGDGQIRVTDANGNTITTLSGDDGWTAAVDGSQADVPSLLTGLKTDMVGVKSDLGRKAWTTYVDGRFTEQAGTIAKKAWTTWVNQVDRARYNGDVALKRELGKRATKSELNALKNAYGSEIDGIKSRLRALEDKTGSPGYGGGYTPPPNYGDDLAPGVGDILEPGNWGPGSPDPN
ncbi:hypothetical protein M3G03_09990 [Aestuariimicrobium sp. p3-SID1156]|uniref:hypothetical protein n=1 Tax=Aestuariimicrobium sp. p3-SID1156 TaxID=2916038 RepID=UPI00223BF845|nr:hypothetical protein [Aestuariimicrobium sp. p3-SID1156]MCT1459860.1 hypothetical protein [Aestuariimicrobium sp. p3-SID1156]